MYIYILINIDVYLFVCTVRYSASKPRRLNRKRAAAPCIRVDQIFVTSLFFLVVVVAVVVSFITIFEIFKVNYATQAESPRPDRSRNVAIPFPIPIPVPNPIRTRIRFPIPFVCVFRFRFGCEYPTGLLFVFEVGFPWAMAVSRPLHQRRHLELLLLLPSLLSMAELLQAGAGLKPDGASPLTVASHLD